MSYERKVIAGKVKAYRKEHKLNQSEFSKACGINKDTLSLIERQLENVTIDTANVIASQMGISTSELLNRAEASYFVFPEKINCNGIEYVTYGIGIIKSCIMIECIRNISTDYEKIKALVISCNNNALSPIHIKDIVEDTFR